MESDVFVAPVSDISGSHSFLLAGNERDAALLTSNEQQILAKWNATTQSYPDDVGVPQLVERQASATPDAVALVTEDQILSYRELNLRANQLAYALREMGVGPNVLVGLCFERSLDLVVAMLGILKAGGAYVPLDVTYPQDRLSFMLEDAGISLLVTRQSLADNLPIEGIRTLSLDSDAALLARQPITDPLPLANANDLVYVIYTSGSTGRPKGVQITQSSLLNLIYWHQQAFAVTSADRATQVTSPAFDATGWELWPYLTLGASVYLPDEHVRTQPLALRDWLVQQQITMTFLPTPLAENMIELAWPSSTTLRFLLTGADTLHHYPPAGLPFILVNNYGPTEATVVATFGPVAPTDDPVRPPSIGYPIANTQIYILDEQLRQVPIGTTGELYIGGAGLAKGYLNRPELTAERFISHPFATTAGARLYKTGDLAYYLPDGQIAFVGRNDHQVKLRGFRIELGEIEAVLAQHPAVQQSAVLAHEDASGEKSLTAYVALRQWSGAEPGLNGHATPVSQLHCFLQNHLPDYMVPVNFVVMESLPITTNGKIDRIALAALAQTHDMERQNNAPATLSLVEDRVARIVETLLKMEQVDVDENFFLLGGHSLLGTQIIARVAEMFGVDLTLRTLFEAPGVRLLAAEIEQLIIAKIEEMSDKEVQRLLG